MMTPRQRDAIRAILDLQASRQSKVPTLADLAATLGRPSCGGAHAMIAGLAARGLIRRDGPGLQVTVLPKARQVFRFNDETKEIERYGPS